MTQLDQLPPEIIEQILAHSSSVSSLRNVATTNKNLHEIVSGNDYALFRSFVRNWFPSINTPPRWREMACALTSRARAWERKAFIARECAPPVDDTYGYFRIEARQKFGYIPVIDSYETWGMSGLDEKREVMAFGAAGRLRIRTTTGKSQTWTSLRLEGDHMPMNDILDVRLLRPNQNQNKHGESVIIRRANGEVSMFNAMPELDMFAHSAKFLSHSPHLDCMDINQEPEPLMVICNTRSLQIFPVHSSEIVRRAADNLPFSQNFHYKHRKRCVKFLSSNRIATGIQFVEGASRAPIQIFDISPTGLSSAPLSASETASALEPSPKGRHSANVIVPLDATSYLAGRPGEVFISGWTDGLIRMHDLRTPSGPVREYWDPVDDGQILSLVAHGHERFLAGSHQNACLKTFDMRTSGTISSANLAKQLGKSTIEHRSSSNLKEYERRDVNIFLALTVHRDSRPWRHLPTHNAPHLPRYRGSIYSLSSPSPSSATIYAGIENHVIQLDFVNTDDLKTNRGGMYSGVLDDRLIWNLSCYERPRKGYESTDAVLLRKQLDFNTIPKKEHIEPGWDERWQLASAGGSGRAGGRWRRGSNTH